MAKIYKIFSKENLPINDNKMLHKGESYFIKLNDKFEKYIICNKKDEILWFLVDDYEKDQIILKYFYTEKEYRKLKILQLNDIHL